MAKRSGGGKKLVIVESPAKARTINKFLGPGYQVEASIGHIRDLPARKAEMPEKLKDEPWAYLGVNTEDNFDPYYIVPADKKKQVKHLRDALKSADELFLATDEDREGEAISWHLHETLKPKVPVHRLVFHEITREAIQKALSETREIDQHLVRAQETRRILDRLYGFDMSSLLWRVVGKGTSAGRVQSVAVRLVVDRERQRMAFVSSTYWDLEATFKTEAGADLVATLATVDGRKLPVGKDFDSSTGELRNKSLVQLNENDARQLAERLSNETFAVDSVEVKPFTQRPYPPFTTSTMQQDANRKLGFGAKRTMQAAQRLYENGYITYMRTDSTTLSNEAINACRSLVKSHYGDNFLHPSVRTYKSKVKNAQEAHEAIRPAGTTFRLPDEVRGELDSDQFRLYDLIWKRTVACQMADAKKQRMTVTVAGGDTTFTASGTSILFEGFLRAYVEGSDDPTAALAERDRILPAVKAEDPVTGEKFDPKDHTTQPPARYTEATLTKTLEERGIGRPSTYASIIGTITDERRNYIVKKGSALVPTWRAFSVTRLMENHFGTLVDYEFTAELEDFLDGISRNEAERDEYLHKFYFGDDSNDKHNVGLKVRLSDESKQIDAKANAMFLVGRPDDSDDGDHQDIEPGSPNDTAVYVRVGKYGPYLQQGERTAPVPDGMPPDEMTLATALELLEKGQVEEEPMGLHPPTGKPIYLRVGRFGPYLQLGEKDDPEKRNQGLLRGMEPADINLEVACRLLELPRDLGQHPETKEKIEAFDGKFGPYIKSGTETRSLPDNLSPLDVSYEQAMELLKQPKTRGKKKPKLPIRVFDKPSPVTESEVRIMDGFYGPYVTDGETNASLRKGMEPQELPFEQALDLLAERKAKGPSKKKKKSTKKKATKKKATKKKTTKKTKKKGTVKKGTPKA